MYLFFFQTDEIMAQDTPVQPRKRQKRDFQIVTMEDLPNEIILKILELVNIKDLFRCMAVNKRLSAIAHDQSLWNIMHLTGYFLSEALIFSSINPKYDDRLFVEICCSHQIVLF
jgi:hypothetical protein